MQVINVINLFLEGVLKTEGIYHPGYLLRLQAQINDQKKDQISIQPSQITHQKFDESMLPGHHASYYNVIASSYA